MTAQLLVLTCRHVLDFTPLVSSFALSRYGFRYGGSGYRLTIFNGSGSQFGRWKR